MSSRESTNPESVTAAFNDIIRHDDELLWLMLGDAEQQSSVWRPTTFWRSYAESLVRALRTRSLDGLRRDNELTRGSSTGGQTRPMLPSAPWKRAVWRWAESLPVVKTILSEYGHAIQAEHSRYLRATTAHASMVLDMLAVDFPDLSIPPGETNGGAEDVITWRGQKVSAEWVGYLCRVADLYRAMDCREVDSVMEIGPGLCQTTLAHAALNPRIRLVVNIDIPPILYVSTQYLKSIPCLEVVDYRATRHLDRIVLEPGHDRLRVYQLAPWQLPRLAGSVSIFANAFSFYEMETEVCRNYAGYLKPLIRRGVMLHSAITGKSMPGGPREKISLDFLAGLFASKFPKRTELTRWRELYGRWTTQGALLHI